MNTGRTGTIIRAEIVLIVSGLLALISVLLFNHPEKYFDYISAPTLSALFCLMISVSGMEKCGLIKCVSAAILNRHHTVKTVSVSLILLPFFLSMFITNDVTLIAVVPISVYLLKKTGRTDLIAPILILQTLAVNSGSMLTPVGNPQNIFIYTEYQADLPEFIIRVLPLTLISICAILLPCFLSGNQKTSAEIADCEISNKKIFAVFVFIFALNIIAIFGWLPYWTALLATIAVTLAVDRSLFLKPDYSLLLTFVFLFIFTGNLSDSGIISSYIENSLDDYSVLTPALLSQVISNVPAAVLLSGFTENWQDLLAGVSIGGFGTPVASMASLITIRIYAREKAGSTGKFTLKMTLAGTAVLILLLLADSVLCGHFLRL